MSPRVDEVHDEAGSHAMRAHSGAVKGRMSPHATNGYADTDAHADANDDHASHGPDAAGCDSNVRLVPPSLVHSQWH
jgi:hypothetical protein